MKLRGEERPPAHRGGKGHAVLARGHRERRVGNGWIVGVHEVEVRPTGHPVEDREIARVLHGVPSHVRDLEPAGEAANHTRNHVEPLALAKLLALREEELIAEADAEKRASFVEGSPERLEEPPRLEI